ncbi:MAG TPA: 4-hydroxy-tetrahydrodipicolinate reductase [Steroidobacteraceae bacterium]|nr:4-hydroxy-tetrahydrodipicolinate reductase [Steroidobacteraceae bacterium]
MSARVGIVGASGRMGAELVKAVGTEGRAQLAAAIDRAGSSSIGKDSGALVGRHTNGVLVSADLKDSIPGLDVVIDFSRAEAVATTAEICAAAGVALMIGTTGLSAETQRRIDAAARKIPVLVSANTSLALNVLLELVRRAAQALPESYDIEIFEAHHRHKVDAPSGTALVLGDAAAKGRGVPLERPVGLTGAKPGERAAGGIGFSVVRGGDVVGEHDVRFLGAGEQLRLSHIATDRAIFARGALAAALWLIGRPANRYQMADFLFEKQ